MLARLDKKLTSSEPAAQVRLACSFQLRSAFLPLAHCVVVDDAVWPCLLLDVVVLALSVSSTSPPDFWGGARSLFAMRCVLQGSGGSANPPSDYIVVRSYCPYPVRSVYAQNLSRFALVCLESRSIPLDVRVSLRSVHMCVAFS